MSNHIVKKISGYRVYCYGDIENELLEKHIFLVKLTDWQETNEILEA